MRIPTAPHGAHRPLPRTAPAASADVHLRLPGWVIKGLYRRARAEHQTISGTVALAPVAHLELPTPANDGGITAAD